MNKTFPSNYFTPHNLTKVRDAMLQVGRATKTSNGRELQHDQTNDILMGGNDFAMRALVGQCTGSNINLIVNTNSIAIRTIIPFATTFVFLYHYIPSLQKYKIKFTHQYTQFYSKNHLIIERTIQAAQLIFNLYSGNYIFVCTSVAITAIETLQKNNYLPLEVCRIKNKTIEYLLLSYDICLLTQPSHIIFKIIDLLIVSDTVVHKLNIAEKGPGKLLLEFIARMYIDYFKLKTFKMYGESYKLNTKHLTEKIDLSVSKTKKSDTIKLLESLIDKYEKSDNVDSKTDQDEETKIWGSLNKKDFIKQRSMIQTTKQLHLQKQ